VSLPAALRTSAAHVFVDDLDAPELDERDAHHLRRVLRLRDGEAVTISDGRGAWRPARWCAGAAVVDGDVVEQPPERGVCIAAAIPKGERLEWMVQKLAEVGVGSIVLVDCDRSVVRWSAERATTHVARLRRVAREAAMQSRRTWLPAVAGPTPFADVAGTAGAVLADPAGPPVDARRAGTGTVIVGPEGGFTEREMAVAPSVSLGDHVLRIETAALVAAVLVRPLDTRTEQRSTQREN